MSCLVGLLTVILSFSSVSFAEGPVTSSSGNSSSITPEKEVSYIICKSRKDVRTVRIQKRRNGTCFTTYTKNGIDQIVSNTSDYARCSHVLTNIRQNLEKATFRCKDISEARVSSSE